LDRSLDRGADILVDHLRRGARVAGHHHQLRERDRRNELLLEGGQGQPAEDRGDDGNQRYECTVAHAEYGQKMHGAPKIRRVMLQVFQAWKLVLTVWVSPALTMTRRIVQLMIGLAALGFGIASLVQAEIGIPPWDVFTQGLHLQTGLS